MARGRRRQFRNLLGLFFACAAMPHGSGAPFCQYGAMTIRSYIAGTVGRLVLVAVLVFYGMIAGALATRMATAQAVAAPGDTVVICTPEGFKTVLWSEVSDDPTVRMSGCACACTVSCSKCGAGAPNLLAMTVDYGPIFRSPVCDVVTASMNHGLCGFSLGGARGPPSRSV